MILENVIMPECKKILKERKKVNYNNDICQRATGVEGKNSQWLKRE
jgi:hypothetical protein